MKREMKMGRVIGLSGGALLAAAILVLVTAGACRPRTQILTLGGGPGGGTFQRYAEGKAGVVEGAVSGTRVVVKRSGGSFANLADVDRGEIDLGLVYAGDAFIGRMGQLQRHSEPTRNVQALASLYGATGQLVVLAGSPVRSVSDLRRKRVAVGNPGSGAALSAERFFRAVGLWGEIIPVYLGYSMAQGDLTKGAVEAVWELVGVPSESLAETARRAPVRLLDLQTPALAAGFFDIYPFYSPTIIPRGTYRGLTEDVASFQDATLWVAYRGVDEEWVYQALMRLYSPEGLAAMREVHPAARDLKLEKGLSGVRIPLHPGAERFWRDKGITLPADD